MGAVPDERSMIAVMRHRRPDVVVVDYALDGGDGLSACFRLKQRPDPPGVVLYSGYVDEVFAVPAAVAQADAIVSKSAPVDRLLEAIRAAAGGGGAREVRPQPELMQAASSRLRDDDLPVLGMLFARLPVEEIAETLGASSSEIRGRALRIIGEMQAADRATGRRGAGAGALAPWSATTA
jgi:NarL family two-component system response regulator LiaR